MNKAQYQIEKIVYKIFAILLIAGLATPFFVHHHYPPWVISTFIFMGWFPSSFFGLVRSIGRLRKGEKSPQTEVGVGRRLFDALWILLYLSLQPFLWLGVAMTLTMTDSFLVHFYIMLSFYFINTSLSLTLYEYNNFLLKPKKTIKVARNQV